MIRVVPLILAVALFMENMDSTVIATSLPAIAADIGADPVSLKLAFTAYFVSLAIFVPLSGWMADRFGAKTVFRAAILVFILGSIACALSNSLLTFVMARFFQGMGSSMMTPLARLVLVRSTPRNELVKAMAWLTIPALIGPVTGPPLGGFLTTYFSWHWIFIINVPIGLIGILLATRFLPPDPGRNERPIDISGAILSGLTFSGIMFGISVISLPAIPPIAGYASIVIGVLAGALYWRHTKRTKYPILDPALFRIALFRAAIIGGSLFRIGVGAFPFLMPLMLQLNFGMTPFESGLTTFVSAFGAIISKFGAERLFAGIGFPRLLAVTAFIACVFLGINALFMPDTPQWVLMTAFLAGGLVRSLFFTGVNALVFADIDDQHASQASAINSVAQQLSVALGVAIGGTALALASGSHGGELALVDFQTAWVAVAVVSALSAIPFLRLPPDAGSHVSGHVVRPLPKPTDAA